jgi:hypothetical protein
MKYSEFRSPSFSNTDEAFTLAYQAITFLFERAGANCSDEYKATEALVEIASAACYNLETLYRGDDTCRQVEDIAIRRNSFPFVLTNPSTLPAKNVWSGNDMRESLKLAPRVLKRTRATGKKLNEEDKKTDQWFRHWFSMFADDIISLEPKRTDIPPRTRVRILKNKKDVGVWVDGFSKWMRRNYPRMVKSAKGRFHGVAKERMQKLQTSNVTKADIWTGFSQMARDKIKASIAAL